MSITIRLAREQDVSVLEELYLEFSNWLIKRDEAIRKALKDPNGELLIAELNGEVVGFLHQVFLHDILHAGSHSYILGLFVKEKHRERAWLQP